MKVTTDSGMIERVLIMKDDGKELFLKRAALWVSTMALVLTCLMGPVAFLTKNALRAVVREEFFRYDADAPSTARAKAHQEQANEVLKGLNLDLITARANASSVETGLLGLSNRLVSIEARLDLALREPRREGKSPVTRGGP
jgi:hypothetical protein